MIASDFSDDMARQICDLIDRSLCGEISEEQRSELESLVCENPAACRLYVGFIRDSSVLQSIALANAGDVEADITDIGVPGSTIRTNVNKGRGISAFICQYPVLSCLAATIVMGLFLSALTIVNAPKRQTRFGEEAVCMGTSPLAEIVAVCDAQWKSSHQTGASLSVGDRLELASGLAEVRYFNGTRLILEGPVQYVIVDGPSGAGRLERGRITAHVPPAALGFTVDSPGPRVIDLGTEFGLAVNDKEETELEVFVGSVRVEVPNDGSNQTGVPLKLKGGAAMQFSRNPIEGGWMATEIRPSSPRFARRLLSSSQPTAELVGHWTLDTVDRICRDEVTGQLAKVIGDVRGGLRQDGGCAVFDGTKAKIDTGRLALLTPGSDFTVTAWIHTTAPDSAHFYIVNNYQARQRGRFAFHVRDGTLTWSVEEQVVSCDPNVSVNDGRWHHVALQRSGIRWTFWIDGKSYSAGTCRKPISSGRFRWMIGGRLQDEERNFCGSIDDLRVYAGALDKTEIIQLISKTRKGEQPSDQLR